MDSLPSTGLAPCRDHGGRDDRADAICVHGHAHGTLSSTIIALHASTPARSIYLYADANPCSTDYRDLSRAMASILP